MSESPDTHTAEKPEELAALMERRARAELAAADSLAPGSDAVAWRGALLAQVAVVKGLPGPSEAAGGSAMSGLDGEAVLKGLEALGHDGSTVFFTLSRPVQGLSAEMRARRLRLQLEAVDPSLILSVDGEAAADVAGAFGIADSGFGRIVRVFGRRAIAVEGLEASLVEPARKRRVWRQLQAAKPEGPVY